MATADPLAHFGGPDVLDPLFQRMRACGLAPRKAQRRILKALKCEKLIILARVAAGAWSSQSREYATREEGIQAQQEALAALERYDWNAYHAILLEQSPPDGIIEPIVPESWGVTVIILIRDGHLVIELLDPKFPLESYSFAIASPEAVDELLATASPEKVAAKSRPAGNARLQEMRRAGLLRGVQQKRAANWALDEYPPDGDIPSELTASEMAEAIQQWRKRKGSARLADDALRRSCVRFLKAYRKKPIP